MVMLPSPFSARYNLLNKIAVFLYYKFLPGCWVWSSHSGILTQWHMWCVQIGFGYAISIRTNQSISQGCLSVSWGCAKCNSYIDSSIEMSMVIGLLMLLTVYKLLSYRKQLNPTWATPSFCLTQFQCWTLLSQNHLACPRFYCLLHHHFWFVNLPFGEC